MPPWTHASSCLRSAVALVTGVLCGLAPAWQGFAGALSGALVEGGVDVVGPGAGKTRDALVIAEIAVALLLLVGAALMLRSFHALSRVNTGIARTTF